MLAIDPITGVVAKFTAESGLPQFCWAASAPIGRRRLCFSGRFGDQASGRAFLAVLDFAPNGTPRVRIIHEATGQLMPDRSPSEQHRDPAMSYYPKFMVLAPNDDGQSWQVALGRSLPGALGRDPALRIDPSKSLVEVMEAGVESHIILDYVSFHDRAAYWATRDGLRELRPASRNSTVLRSLPEEGKVAIHAGHLHLLGDKYWWLADDVRGPMQRLEGEIPGSPAHRQLHDSAHYGIVLRIGETGGVYEVQAGR